MNGTMSEISVYVMFTINLFVVIGGIWRGLGALIVVRDEIRDIKKHMGTKNPPDGLIGDVVALEKEVLRHRDTLIEVTSQIGLRHPGGRT